jgi:hypothetical protein
MLTATPRQCNELAGTPMEASLEGWLVTAGTRIPSNKNI